MWFAPNLGIFAQIGMRSSVPLPWADSACSHGTRYTKNCEAVHERSADLDLRYLTIKVAGREALTEKFHTMRLRLDTASAVILSQVLLRIST
jgi:hypothetical protein